MANRGGRKLICNPRGMFRGWDADGASGTSSNVNHNVLHLNIISVCFLAEDYTAPFKMGMRGAPYTEQRSWRLDSEFVLLPPPLPNPHPVFNELSSNSHTARYAQGVEAVTTNKCCIYIIFPQRYTSFSRSLGHSNSVKSLSFFWSLTVKHTDVILKLGQKLHTFKNNLRRFTVRAIQTTFK